METGILILAIGINSFIILGIVFSCGKGAFLIAGFNTMPKEEQEKYDTAALCRFMGKLMFALCFSMIFWLLSVLLHIEALFVIGLILFFVFIFIGLIYMNTGKRFLK